MENLFGLLTFVLGLSTIVIGLTAQAWKNWREKRFGFSPLFMWLGITTSMVRIPYSALKGAYWLIPADVYALLISFVLVYQWGAYQKRIWGPLKQVSN